MLTFTSLAFSTHILFMHVFVFGQAHFINKYIQIRHDWLTISSFCFDDPFYFIYYNTYNELSEKSYTFFNHMYN